ncbi:hypothetical protein BD779DRAFT_1423961, partial [Infundibulicybe gibba]
GPKPMEGTEDHPVILEQVTKQEFNDFLVWVYKINWAPPPYEEHVLVNTLKLAQRWQIEGATSFSIHHLKELNLSPSRRLELSRMYSLYDWVEPALRTIVVERLSSLSEEDVKRIGFHVYTVIARAKEMMEYERKL